MSPRNLAVVFAPTIMRDHNLDREMTDMHIKNLAIQFLIEKNKIIFANSWTSATQLLIIEIPLPICLIPILPPACLLISYPSLTPIFPSHLACAYASFNLPSPLLSSFPEFIAFSFFQAFFLIYGCIVAVLFVKVLGFVARRFLPFVFLQLPPVCKMMCRFGGFFLWCDVREWFGWNIQKKRWSFFFFAYLSSYKKPYHFLFFRLFRFYYSFPGGIGWECVFHTHGVFFLFVCFSTIWGRGGARGLFLSLFLPPGRLIRPLSFSFSSRRCLGFG